MFTSKSTDQSGVSSVSIPKLWPGNVMENITIAAIITKSNGISTLDTLPIPEFSSFFEINHIIIHTITSPATVGSIRCDQSEIVESPPT